MRTKPVLTDDDVKAMAAAEAHAKEHNWNVTIAIVDDGDRLLHLHRLEGAGASTAEMATGKARTAVLGRRETKVYEDTIKQGRTAFLSAMLEGGVPIFVGTDIVGAVGGRVGRQVRAGCADREGGHRRAGHRERLSFLARHRSAKQKRHTLRMEGVPFECFSMAREPKKAASLAIDDWLVFARRGLNSRVQVVLAG
ncbi:GlcG protein [Candidatus Burkholderia verschuerenii]|uniref:GlcG protein n=1 Tax=Candidatus Burkholderia verschuerenii TaxID=242163 RepID=A0A0L0MDB0_9BURK|nr:GlcG protein [Candidatus Burkholderia verschuerenii]